MEGLRLVTPDLVHLDMRADDRKGAIEELSRLLGEAHCLTDTVTFMRDVWARENLSTTGIGFGVAIPHAKSTAVLRPAVAFGRSVPGIEWDSLDGQPVHLAFLIAVPAEGAENAHLGILAALSRKLVHADFRRQLMEVRDKAEVSAALSGIGAGANDV